MDVTILKNDNNYIKDIGNYFIPFSKETQIIVLSFS